MDPEVLPSPGSDDDPFDPPVEDPAPTIDPTRSSFMNFIQFVLFAKFADFTFIPTKADYVPYKHDNSDSIIHRESSLKYHKGYFAFTPSMLDGDVIQTILNKRFNKKEYGSIEVRSLDGDVQIRERVLIDSKLLSAITPDTNDSYEIREARRKLKGHLRPGKIVTLAEFQADPNFPVILRPYIGTTAVGYKMDSFSDPDNIPIGILFTYALMLNLTKVRTLRHPRADIYHVMYGSPTSGNVNPFATSYLFHYCPTVNERWDRTSAACQSIDSTLYMTHDTKNPTYDLSQILKNFIMSEYLRRPMVSSPEGYSVNGAMINVINMILGVFLFEGYGRVAFREELERNLVFITCPAAVRDQINVCLDYIIVELDWGKLFIAPNQYGQNPGGLYSLAGDGWINDGINPISANGGPDFHRYKYVNPAAIPVLELAWAFFVEWLEDSNFLAGDVRTKLRTNYPVLNEIESLVSQVDMSRYLSAVNHGLSEVYSGHQHSGVGGNTAYTISSIIGEREPEIYLFFNGVDLFRMLADQKEPPVVNRRASPDAYYFHAAMRTAAEKYTMYVWMSEFIREHISPAASGCSTSNLILQLLDKVMDSYINITSFVDGPDIKGRLNQIILKELLLGVDERRPDFRTYDYIKHASNVAFDTKSDSMFSTLISYGQQTEHYKGTNNFDFGFIPLRPRPPTPFDEDVSFAFDANPTSGLFYAFLNFFHGEFFKHRLDVDAAAFYMVPRAAYDNCYYNSSEIIQKGLSIRRPTKRILSHNFVNARMLQQSFHGLARVVDGFDFRGDPFSKSRGRAYLMPLTMREVLDENSIVGFLADPFPIMHRGSCYTDYKPGYFGCVFRVMDLSWSGHDFGTHGVLFFGERGPYNFVTYSNILPENARIMPPQGFMDQVFDDPSQLGFPLIVSIDALLQDIDDIDDLEDRVEYFTLFNRAVRSYYNYLMDYEVDPVSGLDYYGNGVDARDSLAERIDRAIERRPVKFSKDIHFDERQEYLKGQYSLYTLIQCYKSYRDKGFNEYIDHATHKTCFVAIIMEEALSIEQVYRHSRGAPIDDINHDPNLPFYECPHISLSGVREINSDVIDFLKNHSACFDLMSLSPSWVYVATDGIILNPVIHTNEDLLNSKVVSSRRKKVPGDDGSSKVVLDDVKRLDHNLKVTTLYTRSESDGRPIIRAQQIFDITVHGFDHICNSVDEKFGRGAVNSTSSISIGKLPVIIPETAPVFNDLLRFLEETYVFDENFINRVFNDLLNL